MITIKEFPERQFETKEDMFKAFRDNKTTLIAQKKMETKEADAVVYLSINKDAKGDTIKAHEDIDISGINKLNVKLVINTTNILDSHSDVHIKGIWTKSVKEKKDLYLLQEHRMKFDHIISNDIKASIELMSFKDLGQAFDGDTEALIFSTTIDKRNEFMFNQYAKGYVKNHSVGMRYVKIQLALNSESKFDVDEKEIWDKYIGDIANKEDAENQGFFFAVTEAKIVEGSAVPIGSNTVTPIISIEAAKGTSNEPPKGTQTDYDDYYKQLIK